jgi:hypothetical protein
MIVKNKILQKSLLVLLILVLPSSIYTFTSETAESLPQAFAGGNTQGGTQGEIQSPGNGCPGGGQGGVQAGHSCFTQGTQGFANSNTTNGTNTLNGTISTLGTGVGGSGGTDHGVPY